LLLEGSSFESSCYNGCQVSKLFVLYSHLSYLFVIFRYCVVKSDNFVKTSEEVEEQRDICMNAWPAVLEMANECRSAGVAMLVYSCKGKSRSGSVAALCLSYLNFPGCRSILSSHLVVGQARSCIQACNPAYLRWAQCVLDQQQHSQSTGNVQVSQEAAALSWLLIDGKFGVPKSVSNCS
jgi:hypothetical protein